MSTAGESSTTAAPNTDRDGSTPVGAGAAQLAEPIARVEGQSKPTPKRLGSSGSAKPTLGSGTAKPTLGAGAAKPTLGTAATKPSLGAGAAKPLMKSAAGSEPSVANASTPAARVSKAEGRRRWVRPAIAAMFAVAALFLVVLAAQWLRAMPSIQSWLVDYPGHSELPDTAPTGVPAWLGWQHFLNAFFIVLIMKSGWKVRTTTRPEAYWTRTNTKIIRTKNPPRKISLDLWLHLSLDALWVANGIVFYALLFATGQWMRIVPTSWDILPNAVSSALQYASMDWPLENGWIHYNALQVLAYFTVVFVAAPLAVISGLRMSPLWPKNADKLNKAFPVEAARAVHLPVMFFFVAFVIVHVVLVFTTGTLRNLNHMYASQDAQSWTGFWIFATSATVIVVACFLARPAFLSPIASLTGKVSR